MPGRLLAVGVSAAVAAGLAVAGTQQALAAAAPSPLAVGSWSAPFVDAGPASPGGGSPATTVAVLPDGRVLYGGTSGAPRLLTITGSGVTSGPAAGAGFEGDVVQLADGRQLVVGGGDALAAPVAARTADGPLPVPDADAAPVPTPDAGAVPAPDTGALAGGPQDARIFAPAVDGAGAWEAAGSMPTGRAHASAVTLGDGKVAVLSGTGSPVGGGPVTLPVRSTDVFDPATGTWTEAVPGLPGGRSLPPNARVYLAPDGSVFYTGDGQMYAPFGQSPDEALWVNQGTLDVATGKWSEKGVTIPRSSPASVALPMKAPFDSMTILRAGGTLLTSPGSYAAVPTTDLTTIDRDGTVSNLAGPELRNARWFSQATPLPTGEVLLTSGARNDEAITPGAGLPVREAELYDPVGNRFVSLASTEHARTYRNTAVLLPNGQVLVGGHAPAGPGLPVADAVPHVVAGTAGDPSFELFNPPYLYRGTRPHIDAVQSGFAWGENVSLITRDAPEITKVFLMRMPSTQHVMDNDTRTLELTFAQTGPNAISVDVPADGNVAPPGFYYLFVNRGSDRDPSAAVPSVARIVRVGAESDRSPALEPMGEDTVALPEAPEAADQPADAAPAGGALPGLPVDPAALPVDPGAAPADPAGAPLPAAPPGPGDLPVGTLPPAPGAGGRRVRHRH
ncbi:MAG: galactose oxidase-like domain-containing protein [Pseudonocardia sp.]